MPKRMPKNRKLRSTPGQRETVWLPVVLGDAALGSSMGAVVPQKAFLGIDVLDPSSSSSP
eukprot:294288-Pyramimonas_sp.AAC.1